MQCNSISYVYVRNTDSEHFRVISIAQLHVILHCVTLVAYVIVTRCSLSWVVD